MTRTLAFEWRRAASLRSTWGFPLLALAMAGLIAVLIVISAQGRDLEPATLDGLLSNAANPLVLVLVTTICAQAFGHDYRDGTMRLVLSEFPHRSRVFLAKLLVPALIVACTVLVGAILMSVFGPLLVGTPAGGSNGELIALAARQVAIAVWWGLMVAAITALLRNLAAGIVTALVLSGILEGLLTALLSNRLSWLPKVLPFTSATEWSATGAARPGLVALAWVLVLVGSAWALFVKRDA